MSSHSCATVGLCLSLICGQGAAQQRVPVHDATSTTAELVAERRIKAALAEKATPAVTDLTLQELVDYINHRGIPCQLDKRALDELGLSPSVRVDAPPRGLTMRSTISVALGELGLTWTIHRERLLITTREEEQSNLKTKVFNVQSVIGVATSELRGSGAESSYDFDSLIDLVQSTISPDTWDDVGGEGSIQGYELDRVPLLIVSQMDSTLERIERLFARLDTAASSDRRSGRTSNRRQRSSRGLPVAGRGYASSRQGAAARVVKRIR